MSDNIIPRCSHEGCRAYSLRGKTVCYFHTDEYIKNKLANLARAQKRVIKKALPPQPPQPRGRPRAESKVTSVIKCLGPSLLDAMLADSEARERSNRMVLSFHMGLLKFGPKLADWPHTICPDSWLEAKAAYTKWTHGHLLMDSHLCLLLQIIHDQPEGKLLTPADCWGECFPDTPAPEFELADKKPKPPEPAPEPSIRTMVLPTPPLTAAPGCGMYSRPLYPKDTQ